MANFSIGNTVSMFDLRAQLAGGTGAISIETLRNTVWPYGTNLRSLSAYRNTGFWRYVLISSNSAFGTVEMLAPFAGGAGASYTTPWFRSVDYSAITVRATPLYGRTFLRWEFGFTGQIMGFSQINGTAWNGTNELILFARFA